MYGFQKDVGLLPKHPLNYIILPPKDEVLEWSLNKKLFVGLCLRKFPNCILLRLKQKSYYILSLIAHKVFLNAQLNPSIELLVFPSPIGHTPRNQFEFFVIYCSSK